MMNLFSGAAECHEWFGGKISGDFFCHVYKILKLEFFERQ